jgi:hypothetical protein
MVTRTRLNLTFVSALRLLLVDWVDSLFSSVGFFCMLEKSWWQSKFCPLPSWRFIISFCLRFVLSSCRYFVAINCKSKALSSPPIRKSSKWPLGAHSHLPAPLVSLGRVSSSSCHCTDPQVGPIAASAASSKRLHYRVALEKRAEPEIMAELPVMARG